MIYFVFYSDKLVPDGFGGVAKGPWISIRTKYRDDKGLLEHEKVHVRQWWRFWEKKSKLQKEVEAYREQLRHYPDDRTATFASYIANRYGLEVTEADAYLYLTGQKQP